MKGRFGTRRDGPDRGAQSAEIVVGLEHAENEWNCSHIVFGEVLGG